MARRHFLNLSDAGGHALAAMINDAQDRKTASVPMITPSWRK